MKNFSPTLPNYGATTLRIALGLVMLAHAVAKYFLFTLPGTAAFFAQHGFPGWTAYPVFLLEAVGGVLLVLGWHTRWITALLLPVMIGAWFVHAHNGWMFTAPNGGWEYPGFLIFALGAQLLLGGGAWALSAAAFAAATPSSKTTAAAKAAAHQERRPQ
jgi:putative oxidoreductase